VPALAIAVEPVNENEAFAVPALPEADEVTIREAAPKRYQLFKLQLGSRVAGTKCFVHLAQSFTKAEGDVFGH